MPIEVRARPAGDGAADLCAGRVGGSCENYRASFPVVHEVELVHNHGKDVVEYAGLYATDFVAALRCVEHVAVYFGGHHNDLGLAIDADIPSQQAHALLTELLFEVVELLI